MSLRLFFIAQRDCLENMIWDLVPDRWPKSSPSQIPPSHKRGFQIKEGMIAQARSLTITTRICCLLLLVGCPHENLSSDSFAFKVICPRIPRPRKATQFWGEILPNGQFSKAPPPFTFPFSPFVLFILCAPHRIPLFELKLGN